MGLKIREASEAHVAMMPIVASTTVCAAADLNAEHASDFGLKIANSKVGTINNKLAAK